jgi:hypothetical protein
MKKLTEEEKQKRVNDAVELAKRMKAILDGNQADVIHMALGTIVASYAMVIDPVSFPQQVSSYAHRLMTDRKVIKLWKAQ